MRFYLRNDYPVAKLSKVSCVISIAPAARHKVVWCKGHRMTRPSYLLVQMTAGMKVEAAKAIEGARSYSLYPGCTMIAWKNKSVCVCQASLLCACLACVLSLACASGVRERGGGVGWTGGAVRER